MKKISCSFRNMATFCFIFCKEIFKVENYSGEEIISSKYGRINPKGGHETLQLLSKTYNCKSGLISKGVFTLVPCSKNLALKFFILGRKVEGL